MTKILQNKISTKPLKKECSHSPLDTNRKSVRPFVQKTVTKIIKKQFRQHLYKMLQTAKILLTTEELDKIKRTKNNHSQIQYCGYATVQRNPQIVKANGGKFMYKGVASCSCIWRCPICSFKILKARAKMVYKIMSSHHRTKQKMGFVTLTTRHNHKQSLEEVQEQIFTKYRKFQNQKYFRNLKKSGVYLGQINSREHTHTYRNGWHPHLHIIFFYTSKSNEEVEEIQKELIQRWADYSGTKEKPNKVKAQNQKVVYSIEEIKDYVTKWDAVQELTNDFAKSSKGVKPFELLTKIVKKELLHKYTSQEQSDNKCKSLWIEYIEATKGKRRIMTSPILNKLYNVEEKTDEELNSKMDIEDIIISFNNQTWKVITKNDLQPHLIDICYQFKEDKPKQKLEIFNLLCEFDFFRKITTNEDTMIIKINQSIN